MAKRTLLDAEPGEEVTIKSLNHDGDTDLRRHLQRDLKLKWKKWHH